MNTAIVAIVDRTLKRNFPDHGSYCDGYVATKSEHETIIDAERAIEALTPLAAPYAYEPMHKPVRSYDPSTDPDVQHLIRRPALRTERRSGDERRANVEHALSMPMPRRLDHVAAINAVQAQRTELAAALLSILSDRSSIATAEYMTRVRKLAVAGLRAGGFEVKP